MIGRPWWGQGDWVVVNVRPRGRTPGGPCQASRIKRRASKAIALRRPQERWPHTGRSWSTGAISTMPGRIRGSSSRYHAGWDSQWLHQSMGKSYPVQYSVACITTTLGERRHPCISTDRWADENIRPGQVSIETDHHKSGCSTKWPPRLVAERALEECPFVLPVGHSWFTIQTL